MLTDTYLFGACMSRLRAVVQEMKKLSLSFFFFFLMHCVLMWIPYLLT